MVSNASKELSKAQSLYLRGKDGRREDLALSCFESEYYSVAGKVGEEEKRLEVCVKAEENSEGDDKLQLVLYQGEIMLTLEKYEEAVRTFNRAREINPRSHQVNEAINRADRLLKRSKQKDYYKILGIPKTSSASQIKKAYRELAKVYHPDR